MVCRRPTLTDCPQAALRELVARTPDAQRLEANTAEVRNWTGMDAGVVPLVAGLRARGLRTVMSCHGHLDHGTFWPWVMLKEACATADPMDLLRAAHELIFAGFYGGGVRYPDDEVAVQAYPLGVHGGVIIQPACFPPGGTGVGALREMLRPGAQQRLLERSREEFARFERFVRAGVV